MATAWLIQRLEVDSLENTWDKAVRYVNIGISLEEPDDKTNEQVTGTGWPFLYGPMSKYLITPLDIVDKELKGEQ